MGIKIKKSSQINKKLELYKKQIYLNQLMNYSIVSQIMNGSVVFDNPFEIQQKADRLKQYLKKENVDYSNDECLLLAMLHELCFNDDSRDNPAIPYELIHKIVENGQIFHKNSKFDNNPYLLNIKFDNHHLGNFSLKKDRFSKYEVFVYNTGHTINDIINIPQIAAFDHRFSYPCIRENGDTWMSITPNEILTMENEIQAAHGNVLTLGCGMGYFAYMASEKDNVESVTIVESSDDVINLFSQYILPQFQYKNKIKIIKADALDYMNKLNDGEYDYCFADIWIGSYDIEPYLKLKQICRKFKVTDISYWIESSIIKTCLEIFVEIIVHKNPEEYIDFMIKTISENSEYSGILYLILLIQKHLNNNDIIIRTPEELENFLCCDYLYKILSD